MPRTFTVHDAARAAQTTRRQVDMWVFRGYIVPKHTPGIGEARVFSLEEIIALATLAEINRFLKIDAKNAAPHVERLSGFTDDEAVLVIWQGAIALALDSGEKFYDPADPPTFSAVKRMRDVPAMLADPDKRAVLLVNLDHVERRVKAALGI